MNPVPGKVPLVSVLSPTPLSHPGLINGPWLSLSSDCSLGETCSVLRSQTERERVLESGGRLWSPRGSAGVPCKGRQTRSPGKALRSKHVGPGMISSLCMEDRDWGLLHSRDCWNWGDIKRKSPIERGCHSRKGWVLTPQCEKH